MPRTKRNKSKLREKAQKILAGKNNSKLAGRKHYFDNEMTKIKDSVKQFDYIFLVKVQDMRNSFLQRVRADWKSKGRIFFHKNTILTMALGSDRSDEIEENLCEFSKEIYGECGILITNEPAETVREYVEKTTCKDYARMKSIVTETITIPAGIVSFGSERDCQPVPRTMEIFFKKLEVPVVVENNVLCLLEDYTICKIGDSLSENQANVLKLLGYKLATSKLLITHYYDKTKKETFRFLD
ncbi:ribosomal protein L10-domain-containing protein [Gigaspora margarita]|uniref:Ribosomal protein L10-domain-containing protein n=1 Tax=Gigaspora margarita TaxID=4874 RepID=A0A8H3X7F8_GIGMA|nr:ribosomal protein L10-domain-containing protein [Gigaspora margarita]